MLMASPRGRSSLMPRRGCELLVPASSPAAWGFGAGLASGFGCFSGDFSREAVLSCFFSCKFGGDSFGCAACPVAGCTRFGGACSDAGLSGLEGDCIFGSTSVCAGAGADAGSAFGAAGEATVSFTVGSTVGVLAGVSAGLEPVGAGLGPGLELADAAFGAAGGTSDLPEGFGGGWSGVLAGRGLLSGA